jgi:hypothetical protein
LELSCNPLIIKYLLLVLLMMFIFAPLSSSRAHKHTRIQTDAFLESKGWFASNGAFFRRWMPTVANGEAMKFLSFAGDRKRDLRRGTRSGKVQAARLSLLAFVASFDRSQPWAA